MLAGLARLRMMLESYLFLTLFSQLFYLQLWMGSVCECERRSVCECESKRNCCFHWYWKLHCWSIIMCTWSPVLRDSHSRLCWWDLSAFEIKIEFCAGQTKCKNKVFFFRHIFVKELVKLLLLFHFIIVSLHLPFQSCRGRKGWSFSNKTAVGLSTFQPITEE